MIAKLSALFLVLLFGWALVYTGDDGQTEDAAQALGDQSKRPSRESLPRDIEVLEETGEHRLVQHPLGTTEVPLAPRRIVSLSSAATDSLLALGVEPILAEVPSRDLGWAVHLTDRLKNVPMFRGGEVLSLEAVSEAKPDLILMSVSQNGTLYPQLSKIAPTVSIASSTRGDRELRILDVGAVLGIPDQAQRRLAEYRRLLKGAKSVLAAKAADQTAVFLRFRRNTCVVYTQTTMFGPLLFRQLGIVPDPAVPVGGGSKGWDVLSLERLSTIRAEHIFVVVDKDSEHYLKNLAESPIWREIPAVRHRHVHRVASGTWLGGDGLLGCEAIVHDVLAAMVPGEHP